MASAAAAQAPDAPISIYEVHLGSWLKPSTTAELTALGFRRSTGSCPTRRDGIHPRRADADHRTSVRRILGLSAARPVRAQRAVRPAAKASRASSMPACCRYRHDPRLGAGAFSDRSAWSCPLRRHRALRASRSARGLPPGLEYLHLQFRPSRGARLPDRQRALLAGAFPRRRAARRCGGIDAVSRLQPPRGRMDPEHLWRPRKSGGDRLPAPPQRGGRRTLPRRDDDRRGIDRVARRHPADRRGRAGLLLQMEHGLDARHPRYMANDPVHRQLPSRRYDLRPALRVLRELHPAAVAR